MAWRQHEDELPLVDEIEELVSQERARLASLRMRFTPLRTTLLTSLSTIFPIELSSPPDLLYTILSVPLPIPLAPSDPAPPPYKDVTEDMVATALGYAAQVVQLLAAYLGKSLVYPVTCVGSRSLIRDGISAMMGPRMFPLFSRGVDTYRYEYGVFLLNKDIELLMADRDLRALDMRHTLPNLKNLLLTLTHGEGVSLTTLPRPPISPNLSVSGLETPPRAESPPPSNTPKASAYITELPPEGNANHTDANSSPPASGSTTPTAADRKTQTLRTSFSGLAGFLRARYPSAITAPKSSSSTLKSVVTLDADTEASDDAGQEEEDDTRTIRSVGRGDQEDIEGKASVENGNANGAGSDGTREKWEEHTQSLIPDIAPTTPPIPIMQHHVN